LWQAGNLKTAMKGLVALARRRIKLALRHLIQRQGVRPSLLTPARWGLQDDPQRGLLLQGLALEELLESQGSPLYVVNAGVLRDNARRFQQPSGTFPGCEVFYSYKTNPVPGVLQVLHAQGIGAEVISHYELWLARKLGVPPDRIIFNGPGKSTQSIREAIQMGVQVININHAEEVGRVAAVARELGRRPRVGLRVTTEHSWSGQFGTPLRGGAAMRAYADAISSGVLDVVGVHAHLGGMIHDRQRLLAGVGSVLDFVEDLHAQLGLSPEILNFGGSLATPTVEHLSPLAQRLNQTFHRPLPEPDADHSLSIEDYVSTLTAAVSDRYARFGRPMPRLFLEPGRSMTGNAQMLLARVMTTKQASDASYLILDAGINIAESVRSEYHKIFPLRGSADPDTETYTLVGPICSPADTLMHAWRARRMGQGDALAIMDAGGYFVPFSTSFSYPQPAIVMVDGGEATLIRRAERFEDLTTRDQPPV
jgi:diaminopimelate decarboxylase